MTEADISIISSRIDEEKDYLQFLSRKIWENPELKFEEHSAHALLTEALTKYGFEVQEHYLLPTAFRGEYCSSEKNGPTIAVLCEYDALPKIGHACGHNLIAEAGIAAGMAVKAAMEADPSLHGKIVVLGTPAEEGGSGKAILIDHGTFQDIEIALMVHPAKFGSIYPKFMLCVAKVTVTFTGRESHASSYPWEGRNALDAAVTCYNNVALLRQQIKPSDKIHGIITKGGAAANIIPGETEMKFFVRAQTNAELLTLNKRFIACCESAAMATGCEVSVKFLSKDLNVITNKVLAEIFKEYSESFGLEFPDLSKISFGGGATDMGNVSHIVPSIHPFYGIGGEHTNHSKGFTSQSSTSVAQLATLAAAKAMAIVAIKMMRYPDMLQEAKDTFQNDLSNE